MNLIEENAKEPRKVDYDLKQMLDIVGIQEADIYNTLAAVYGENDGANWHYIVQFKAGDYAYLVGGCDYTGWGCQDFANIVVRDADIVKCVDAVPEDEDYYKRGNIRNAIKRQLAYELPFGVIES